MNRKELVDTVAREAELTTAQADAAVGAVLDAVISTVAKGEKVSLHGFGTFETRHRAARSGHNAQTGEALQIAASDVPAFRPATAFKQAVVNH